jgi:hypothetical protein
VNIKYGNDSGYVKNLAAPFVYVNIKYGNDGGYVKNLAV